MPAPLDLIGQRFGRLTVLSLGTLTPSGKHRRWICRCDCGTETGSPTTHGLRKGHTQSCGCLRLERSIEAGRAAIRHGQAAGGVRRPTYNSWRSMLDRAVFGTVGVTPYYLGRGITVCERWRSFENFLADMGERPLGMTLDRIDVDGNYEPRNCRWATPKQQARNRRPSRQPRKRRITMNTQTQQPPRPPPRMTLAAVTNGKVDAPMKLLLMGMEGVGKSTFAASSPSPIFLAAEEGTNQLDVARFPRPESWLDVLDAVRTLSVEDHNYKTLIVDTLDAIEPFNWAEVCRKGAKPDIESFGYGKGYVAALDEWRQLLAAFERLRAAKGMHIISLAHSVIKTFKNPDGEDFDRYQLKLHDKAGGLLKEWTDCNLFAQFETLTAKVKGKEIYKGISTGARILRTQRTAAWDAKNRFDLPETLPLDWQAFIDAVAAHRPADPGKLKAAIEDHLAQVGEEKTATLVRAAVIKAGDDAAELARIHNKLSAMVAQKIEVSHAA